MTQEKYKRWDISYDPSPTPIRAFDWVAIHPDYEAWTEDGEWQSNGLCVHAPNRKELLEAIDEWELENA
jgi:hypothetical protein